MIRIAFVDGPGRAVTMRVEGRLVGPWVTELRRSCEQAFDDGRRLILDLADVSFVDDEGLALLRSLRENRMALTNCSPFLSEQLRGGELHARPCDH